jgi:hypothetical protein
MPKGTPFPDVFRKRRSANARDAAAALPALAVDGRELLQRAGSARAAAGSSAPQPDAAASRAARREGGPPQGPLGTGVVVEGKRPFVPHDVRISRLLGDAVPVGT